MTAIQAFINRHPVLTDFALIFTISGGVVSLRCGAWRALACNYPHGTCVLDDSIEREE